MTVSELFDKLRNCPAHLPVQMRIVFPDNGEAIGEINYVVKAIGEEKSTILLLTHKPSTIELI